MAERERVMEQYIITAEQHGFTVREGVERGMLSKTYAFTTLEEALDGIRSLFIKEQPHD
jgi:hypothetical protein